jgi:hypothetical protein
MLQFRESKKYHFFVVLQEFDLVGFWGLVGLIV